MPLKNILNTVAYYDVMDFPLTSFEIWKYLIGIGDGKNVNKKHGLGEIIEALESEEVKKHVEEFRGFYFLRGRRGLVEKRIQNGKNSIKKLKIAEKVTWWLRFVPFVRMVAVTGTLAMENSERGSDIDFFVVLEKGRIFTGRLLVTFAAHLLGRRRHGSKIKNRICLNYFITTGSLEIKRRDLFAANEYSFVYPLFGFDVYRRFGEANIGWMGEYKPNFEYEDLEPAKYFVRPGRFSQPAQKFKEDLINILGGDRMEAWLRKKQVARISRNPLSKREGAYIEATDENLVFLPEPQGPKVKERYEGIAKEIYSADAAYDESFG